METKEILNQQWVEAPVYPREGLRPLVLRPKQNSPEIAHPVQDVNGYEIDTKKIVQLANRKLCDITGTLMDRVGYIEHYGRVVLVKFVPIQRVDPIMAVPLVKMTGWSRFVHNVAYKEMVNDLLQLEMFRVWSFEKWYKRTRTNVEAIIKHSQKFLHPDEWNYYSQQMYESLANPQRKIGK